jgi:predicted DNA-binding transcriptional regulator AlpA
MRHVINPYLSVTDSARMAGIPRPTMYLYVRCGDIESVKIGRTLAVLRTSVADFMAKRYGKLEAERMMEAQ